MNRFVLATASTALLTACSSQPAQPEPLPDGTIVSSDGYQIVPVADGLEFPWGMAALPNGDLLVTEREGRLRLIRDGKLVDAPITGTPSDVLVDRQGGYFGVTLDSDFETNRRLYMSYAKGVSDSNTTAVIAATLSEDATALSDVSEIFTGQDRGTALHFGGRMELMPDGTLLVTLGEGYRYMDEAQNTDSLHGKVARINTDGTLPTDNPFANGGGHPAIYSYGHRNVQGLVVDADRGIIYEHEHGPKGGDEINTLEPGSNYGWPVITYGINYDGTLITEDTEADGMAQPVFKWVPSIAPSGMTMVQTAGFEDWAGDLLVGAMNGPNGRKLVRIDLDDAGNVVGSEDLLGDLQVPYRDVLSTPNAIYVATADLDGAIYRLEKAQ